MVSNISRWFCVLLCLGSFAQNVKAGTAGPIDIDVYNNSGSTIVVRGFLEWNGTSWQNITKDGGGTTLSVNHGQTLRFRTGYTFTDGAAPPARIKMATGGGSYSAATGVSNEGVVSTPWPSQLTFTWGPASCTRIIDAYNNSLVMRRFYWVLNGSVVYSEDIPPGGMRSHTLSPSNCASYTMSLDQFDLTLTTDYELLPTTNTLTAWTNVTGVPNYTNVTAYTPPAPVIGSNVVSGIQAPISWSPQSSTSSIISLQEGFASTIISQQQFDKAALDLLTAIRTNTAALREAPMDISEMTPHHATANSYSNSIKSITFPMSPAIASEFPDMNFTLGVHFVDLDPLHNPSIAVALGYVRMILLWTIAVMLVFACLKCAQLSIGPMLTAPQGSSASAVPVAGSGSALVMATAIAVLIGAGVLASLGGIGVMAAWSYAIDNPFQYGGYTLGTIVYFVNSFFPLPESLAMLIAYWAFRVACIAGSTGVALAIRFLVGSLAFLLVTPCYSGEVEIYNGNEDFAYVAGVAVPPGETLHTFLSGGSYLVEASNTISTVSLTVEDSHAVKHWFTLQSELAGYTEQSVDFLLVWWQGFGVAAGFWALGFMFSLVKRMVTPTADP